MNRLIIRDASLDDAQTILDIYAPYVQNTAVSFEYEVPSLEEFTQRIQKISAKYPYFVAELDGEIVGYAYADAFKWRAAYNWGVESTIYLRQDKKHLGIGRPLYQAVIDALEFQGILNVNACIAYTEQEDETLTADSPKFHERLGFKTVAHFHKCGYKFDRWYDMIWMEKLVGIRQDKQPPVKSFPQVGEAFWANRR